MGTVRDKTLLSELTVKEAMRRQLVTIPETGLLEQSIRQLIKYKVSGLLVVDQEGKPTGVISKTDLMGAYYAELPISSQVSDIMVSPPLFCDELDSLDQILHFMRENKVYRLYVQDSNGKAIGVIAYPDIVGMLYSFCRDCPQSKWQKTKQGDSPRDFLRFKVKEIMTPSVMAYADTDSLSTIMEGLSANKIGAVLIVNGREDPVGVVSKTDLILAYRRGVAHAAVAAEIMSEPVKYIEQEECLETALHLLIFSQLHRIFVNEKGSDNMVGVLSLSDAARMRSGSCHACISSRIKIEE